MALNLGELVAIISADDSRFRRVMGGVQSSLQSVGKLGGLAALAGAATHVAVALAPAAGLLAAMPALWIANKVAAFAYGLAVEGVSDVLGAAMSGDAKAFKEELEKLPPQVRGVVRELGGALSGLQKNAQIAFFAPMRKSAKGLADDLHRPIGRGVATVTAAMGRMGARVLGVAREAKTLAFIKDLALGIADGFDQAGHGVPVLLRGVRDFAGSAVGAFGKMGKGIGDTMERVGLWLSSKAAVGKPLIWVEKGMVALGRLRRIATNVGETLKNVFKNAGTGQTAGLLATIEKLTARMNIWAASADGQAKIQRFFFELNQVTGDLVVILPIMGGALALVAKGISALPEPAQGAVAQFLAMSLILGVIAGRIGPLVKGVGLVAGGVGKLAGAINNPNSRLRGFASRVGDAGRATGRFAKSAATNMGRAAAATGRAALSMTVAAGRTAAAFGRAALAATLAAGRMAGSMAMTAARVVAGWALMAVQSLMHAARMAAAWLIAMGPVGWVVAAAIAAVALIIANWDKVAGFFSKTLPRWLRAGFTFIVTLIKNAAKFGFLGPVGLIIAHWGRISGFFTRTLPSAVSGGIRTITGWLSSLPNRVLSAVGDMGKLLVNAGKSVLIGFWNGMVGLGGWLSKQIGNLVRAVVPGPVLRVLGIASPSRLFAGYGRNVVEGMALGITRNAGMVARAATGLATTAAGSARPLVVPGRAGVARPGGGGAVMRRAAPLVRLVIDVQGADPELKRRIRRMVKVDGGGSVQVAFGSR